jgi:hypothetical protein
VMAITSSSFTDCSTGTANAKTAIAAAERELTLQCLLSYVFMLYHWERCSVDTLFNTGLIVSCAAFVLTPAIQWTPLRRAGPCHFRETQR